MFANQTVYITGGTGSWGYELDPRLRFSFGDIRDKAALVEASSGTDFMYHLAEGLMEARGKTNACINELGVLMDKREIKELLVKGRFLS